ncbi:TIGR01620 family protein [Pseudomonas sp.]|jgi:putative membrane protein|uniref:TIGR01620 family protein n=1 Tax=Pseudomonas sp. TaxID=306 RepID=UPI00272B692D|nr:TIGR01620 family protein [Pseudomonas sp.]
MNTRDKTRILDSWDETSPAAAAERSRILGEAQLDEREQQLADSLPLPGPINAPATSPWPRRLLYLALLLVAAGVLREWLIWTLAAWAWTPLAGGVMALVGFCAGVVGLLGWRDLRRQRSRLTEVEHLRAQMRLALLEPDHNLPADWLGRLEALYADTPLGPRLRGACADLDSSHSAAEVARRLDLLFYQPLDAQARQLIRREATGTGLLVATSPWVTVDLLLVVWRNLRMMQAVAVCFGLPIGQLGRWRLARHVLRNIALAGGTEMAIGALSDSLLSGLLEKLAARIGQGIGIGLYSARLGHFTLDLCRAVPVADHNMLAEDNRGIIAAIRERLGREERGKGL